MEIIGRKSQIKELENIYKSGKSELVSLYGRRRVGKTFLIDKVFQNRFTFRHTGLSPLEIDSDKNKLTNQLIHFSRSLELVGIKVDKRPTSWFEAFYILEDYLLKQIDQKRLLVFFDELPWMDTPKSNFMTAFEGFWNGFASHYDNIMVIICGSSSSWIISKFINNHGGLYGRITREIKLDPFSLEECEKYLLNNGVNYSKYDIALCYMILGGIPYYLNYLRNGYSLQQNIDNLFFSKNRTLSFEFDRLFSSLFNNHDEMKNIIRALSKKSVGLTRIELLDCLKISDGGTLSDNLKALMESNFIIKYSPYLNSKRDTYYKVIDPFCLFYLRFVENKNSLSLDFWKDNIDNQQIITWKGFAFENLCFNHVLQIKQALGIYGMKTSVSLLNQKGNVENKGSQIDLIIERNDNIINICEIKFYKNFYLNDRDSHFSLLNKEEELSKRILKRQSIQNVLITTYGLKDNQYSNDFANVIVLDDLFK